MFTDIPKLIFRARETVNTNIFYLSILYNDIIDVPIFLTVTIKLFTHAPE